MDDPLIRDGMVLAVALLAALGAYLVHRFAPATLRENNEFTGYTFSFVGLVYGVYLAFTVVIVWEHFETAEDLATSEATRLSELWRDAGPLPGGGGIQQKLYDYTRSVVDDDWPSLARDHRGSEVTSRKYEDLWRSYYSVMLDPNDAKQAAFFRESIAQLNDLGRERRMRILTGAADIPLMMWGLLVVGGLGMIGFIYLIAARHLWLKLVITAFCAGVLAWAVLIVFALVDPYSGDVSVKTDPFLSVLQSFDARRAAAPGAIR